MANGPDDLAVLAEDLATLPRADVPDGLEPEHHTTAGYEQHIAAAAAARRSTNKRSRVRPGTFTAALLAGVAVLASAPTLAVAHAATVPAMIVRSVAPLTVGQSQHSAFPSLAVTDEGTRLVYRRGTNHYASRDGAIETALSTDGGQSFGPATIVRSGGADYRDPSLFEGHLTWFTASSTSNATGAFTQDAGWGPSARIDTLPYAAITAPLVRLPSGELGAVFYGRKAGETIDTSWMGWSSDNGLHWTTNRITNQIAAKRHTNEPYAVVDGDDTHVFYRWGSNSGIGMRTTTGSGHTGWGPERQILSNATGRPTVIRTASGMLVMVYRDLASKSAELAWSTDHGQTWVQGLLLLASPAGSPNGMTYASMVEDQSQGVIRGVVGMEQADGSSRLYGFELDPA